MDFIPGRDGEGVPRVLACFMTALLDGQPMQLVDGGLARRTIVSIHDAIRAVVPMINNREQSVNQIFNVGNRHNEVTMKELAELMREAYAAITLDFSYIAEERFSQFPSIGSAAISISTWSLLRGRRARVSWSMNSPSRPVMPVRSRT